MSIIRSNRNLRLIPYTPTEQTSVMKHIMTWTAANDNDDTVENLLEGLPDINDGQNLQVITLNYKFMNELLLEFCYNIRNIITMYRKYNDSEKSYIQGLISYINSADIAISKQELIKNTFYVYADLIKYTYYNYFTTFITFDNYVYNTNQLQNIQSLVLYRGFDYNRYKLLLDEAEKISIGGTFNTGCFLSTSVLEYTATQFIVPDSRDGKKIIWQINILPNYFHKFYFSYLSNRIVEISDFNIQRLEEIEFLININAKLQLINKYIRNDITYYEWNFIEYESLDDTFFDTFKRFINQIFDFINIKNSSSVRSTKKQKYYH